MDAIERTDALEAALMARIGEIYADALRTALKRKAAFLRKVEAVASGRIKPPQYYVDTGQVEKWRRGFLQELIRQENVIEGICRELSLAGVDAAKLIRDTLPAYYEAFDRETADIINAGIVNAGLEGKLTRHTKQQIKVLTKEAESPFSKLAYNNLGSIPAVRRRLQNELAQATILGEDQRQIIKRIRAVTGQAEWQARRVAQTERTRVQSQARWEQSNRAEAMGVRVVNEWSAGMVNSRETHIALNGKKARQGECFPGSPLRFPGDPTAPAREVINCRCVLVPDVLMDGQEVVNGEVVG